MKRACVCTLSCAYALRRLHSAHLLVYFSVVFPSFSVLEGEAAHSDRRRFRSPNLDMVKRSALHPTQSCVHERCVNVQFDSKKTSHTYFDLDVALRTAALRVPVPSLMHRLKWIA